MPLLKEIAKQEGGYVVGANEEYSSIAEALGVSPSSLYNENQGSSLHPGMTINVPLPLPEASGEPTIEEYFASMFGGRPETTTPPPETFGGGMLPPNTTPPSAPEDLVKPGTTPSVPPSQSPAQTPTYSGSIDPGNVHYESGHLNMVSFAKSSPSKMYAAEHFYITGMEEFFATGTFSGGRSTIPDEIFRNTGLLAGLTDEDMLKLGWELGPDGNWRYNPNFTPPTNKTSTNYGYGYGGGGGYSSGGYQLRRSLSNWRIGFNG